MYERHGCCDSVVAQLTNKQHEMIVLIAEFCTKNEYT